MIILRKFSRYLLIISTLLLTINIYYKFMNYGFTIFLMIMVGLSFILIGIVNIKKYYLK